MKAVLIALVFALLTFSAFAQQTVSGCDVCQFFVKEIETEVTKYEGQITDAFKKQVCGKLPAALNSPCSKFVDAYGAQAIKYLLNEFDRVNVCQKLRLCQSSEWIKNIIEADEAFAIYQMMQQQAVQLDVSETPYCGICQFVIANLEQFVNQSESQIEQEALKLCKLLPDQYVQLCDTVALMYLPNIIEQLLKQEPPKVACCQLTLCSDSCGSKAIEPKKQEKVAPKPAEANDGNCALCTYVVATVEQYLANNQTEQQIIAEVNQLCGKLPSQFAQACVNLADQYIPYIIYYIEAQYPADKVCKLIGMCSASTNANMKAFAQLVITQLPSQEVAVKAKDQNLCQVCTLAMTILQQYLNSNSTDAQIKQALENLCSQLPSQYSSMCTVLVDTYEPTLLSMIREYIASHQLSEICHRIGVCSSAKLALTQAEVSRLAVNANAEFCAPCLAVVTFAENKLNDTATRQLIKNTLLSACDEIPVKEFTGLCKILVMGQTDALINGILAKATPSEVCQAVHLCQAKKAMTPNPLAFLVAPEKKQENALLCPICKEAVAVADNYITSNSTLAQIKTTVESVICDKFPDSFRQPCDQFIDTYAPYLISAFVRGYLSPDAVCTEIRACSPQKVEKVMITVN